VDLEGLARRRRAAQRLHGRPFSDVERTVRGLLAVQAQDVEPAAWSVGMRTRAATFADVLRAVDAGRLLRTHVLRPTWHLVHPEDLRWLLTLTAPRVHRRNASRYRQLGLDPAVLDRGAGVIDAALASGPRTRAELGEALRDAGIDPTGQRLAYLVMHAELERVTCSGPRRGTRQTYARFDERVPPAEDLGRDAALAELAVRFFAGHGPGTAGDLGAWASLTLADVRAAIGLAGDRLETVEIAGRTFHLDPGARRTPRVPPTPHVLLLQAYDEYVSGALDSRDVHDRAGRMGPRDRPVFNGLVLLDGQLHGHWRRTIDRDAVHVEARVHEPFGTDAHTALGRTADRYASFHGLDAEVTVTAIG
jgi:hypothetical protein